MYAHLMDKALDKDYRERLLSDHLAISRAERPDEWDMDEYIKKAIDLEKRVLRLEEGLKEVRNGLHCHTQDWVRDRINEVLK